MTIRTLAAAKAGRTEVRAHIRWRVPLTDPEAEGNLGLQGFDEGSDSRAFPNAGLARHWAEIRALAHIHLGHDVDHMLVEVGRWEGESFTDDKYGHVEDAQWWAETEQYGYPGDANSAAVWDEPSRTDG